MDEKILDAERINELCMAYPPLANIAQLVGGNEANHSDRVIGKFLLHLVDDLSGYLPITVAEALVETPTAVEGVSDGENTSQ